MSWKALAKVPGIWAASRTVTAIFVTGAATEAMSTPWNSSLLSMGTVAWPVMHRIGTESAEAEYMPVIMSVPPGPDVPMHTPMFPAPARLYPSAMWEAPSTCRASTCPIPPWFFIAEYRGLMAAPGTPKAWVAPSFSRMRTMASTALMSVMVPCSNRWDVCR